MCRSKAIHYYPVYLLLILLLFNTAAQATQHIVKSGNQSAGFSFTTNSSVAEPVIHYQQNIQMLSHVSDKPTLSVFGDGRVLVHYPVYMKKAGDYEMSLSETELANLIQSFSKNGVLDFDEARVRKNIDVYKNMQRVKGKFHQVSDAVETSITVRLDEYQKNSSAQIRKNYRKDFRWSNIEYAAKQFKQEIDLENANKSVVEMKGLMNDARLIKMERQ